MRKLIFSTALLLLFSCTETGSSITSPGLAPVDNETDTLRDHQWTCRNNMVDISGICLMWFCQHSSYPNSLEELGEPYCSMACPECGLPYTVTGDQYGYQVNCPGNCGHGFIVDGIPSWEPDHTMGIGICRSIMRMVGTQCIIFFATEERWPRTLDELGWDHLRCPACGDEYIYSVIPTKHLLFFCYYVCCPMEHSHGYIQEGIASW